MDVEYSPCILIVDDKEENLSTLKSSLQNISAQIVMAQSGKEAVLHTKQKDFALIILDVQMPEMDGYETASLIRQGNRNHHTPIVFLTAVYFDQSNIIKGYHAGAVDYITKPFNRDILLSKIKVFLDLDKAKRDLIKSKVNFENVVQDQTDMICRTDKDFRPTFVNRAFLLAFSSTFERISSLSLLEAVSQADREKISRALMLLSPSNPILKLKHSLTVANMRQLTVTTVFRSLYNKDLLLTGYQLVIRDNTLQSEAIEELLMAKNKAEKTAHSKARFLANLNHDLKTPLNPIIGMTEILLDSPLNAEQKEDLLVIHKSALKLLSMLNTLAGFHNSESGQVIFDNAWFDLKTGLSNIVKECEAAQHEKGNRIRLFYKTDVPENIYADQKRIGQIICYLVTAIANFAQYETININVGSKMVDNNLVGLSITVSSSIAIPDNFTNQTMRFLEWGNPDISHEYGGIALCLAVSKNLCKLMGGALSFKKTDAQASEFQFEINVEVEPKNAKNTVSILVVEDNVLNQKVLGATLKKQGFMYELASDGKAAFEKFKKTRFDFILMDIQMPVMDGYETTRQIRIFEKENPKGIPAKIFALTANATSEDQKKCLAVGMDGFLAKPFKFLELEKIIHQIADQK
jgi:CheY-like chemotaxis protein